MTTFKLVLLGIMAVLALVVFLIGYLVPETNFKKNIMARIKLIVRVRAICFVVMLVLLLICMFV